MKTLVIDCTRSKNVQDLVNAVSPFSDTEVVRFDSIGKYYEPAKSIDALVISGSGYRSVNPVDREKFTFVTSLIKNFCGPVLGVCFAHQLVCHAFGAKLATLNHPVFDKFELLRVIESDEIFEGYKHGENFHAVEYHNDYVLKQGLSTSDLTLLADSQSCEVEAVKHNSKPIYGIQFHAERYRIGKQEHKEGLQIFKNFYKHIAKK